MDYQLIANILLAVSSFFSLVVMLRWDLLMLQDKEYSNKQFMAWIQESDESYSTKRVIPMAALVACGTPWARESWMVVLLIAVAMMVLAITFLMAVVAACAVSLFTAHFSLEAGMMLMLFTAFSYALVLGVNSVAGLFVKKKQ